MCMLFCYFSKTTVNNRPVPHRQSTDTLAAVDRNISAEVSAECQRTYRPIVSTDGLLTKTTCRPTLDRHIGRVSVDISAKCRSPYWLIVSTDTRSTDALSTHDLDFVQKGLIWLFGLIFADQGKFWQTDLFCRENIVP